MFSEGVVRMLSEGVWRQFQVAQGSATVETSHCIIFSCKKNQQNFKLIDLYHLYKYNF